MRSIAGSSGLLRFVAAGLLPAALAACGGSTSTGPNGPPEDATAEGAGGDATSDSAPIDSGGPDGADASATMDSGRADSGGTADSGSTTDSGMTTDSGTTSDSGTGDSGATCSAASCSMPGFGCCGGACVNLKNDIFHCGTCTNVCGGTHPYCDMGTCGSPPCTGGTCTSSEFCCGTACCTAGQLCCDVPGPVVTGPQCQAPDPITHSCKPGCTGCVCASPDTPIATPGGDRRIDELAVGDLVYSVDHEAIVAVPILRVNRVPVHDHHVVRVVLATGRVLEISPRHPTADGRTFGDLRAGGALDGIGIVSAELVPYGHAFTYDILPASGTHGYFAGGALVGSTLAGEAR